MAARRCALRHIGHYLPAPVLPVRPALLEVLEHVAVDSQGDEPFAFGIAGGGAGRYRWLQEIVDGSSTGPDAIAARESCSRRHVMMMNSLSFLAPRSCRGRDAWPTAARYWCNRLTDAPSERSWQWHMLGTSNSLAGV